MRALAGRVDQGCAFKRFGRKIGNTGLEFLCELLSPTAKRVGPCFDGVLVGANFVQRTNPAPTIVIDKTHRGFMPARFTNKTPLQSGRHDIVAIPENVCFDREIVSNNSLDWIAPAVDQRPQILDDCAGKSPSHGTSINARSNGCERRKRARTKIDPTKSARGTDSSSG